jgi:putative transcriptional regulator
MPKNPEKYFKFKLEDLMWEHRIKSIKQLSEKTKISRKSLAALKSGNVKVIHLSTVFTLCQFFNCGIDDLIQIVREEK